MGASPLAARRLWEDILDRVNGGVKIWYRVEGTLRPDSVPLLLIHGGPGATVRPFEKTIGPEIAKTRPVVYLDYRGAGRSDRPKDPAQYSWSILADDAEAVRRHLGIENWAVFGHSNGAATAITYAVRHHSHLAALVLCDPLLSSTDLEMNMVHKVTRAPADQSERARAAFKSGETMSGRFEALLEVLDGKSGTTSSSSIRGTATLSVHSRTSWCARSATTSWSPRSSRG